MSVPPAGNSRIPSHMVWAILTTLFCCLPFGIVSIVFAAKVDGLQAAGNIAAAQEASNKAKLWAMIAAGSGVVAGILWFALVGLSMIGQMGQMG